MSVLVACQDRDEARGDGADQGHACGKERRRGIDADRLPSRKRRGSKEQQAVNTPVRDEQPADRSERPKQQSLGTELTDDVGAGGADRGPDRQLTAARCSPGQQQVGKVGARHEQDEPDRLSAASAGFTSLTTS